MTEDELKEMERRLAEDDLCKCPYSLQVGLGEYQSSEISKDDVRTLIAEVRRLTVCSCGEKLSRGMCHICDNDD